MTSTYKFCADTHWYLFCNEYPVQWIDHSLTYECPNHDSVRHVISSWIEFSLTRSFGLWWWGQTRSCCPIQSVKLKKVILESHKQWEYNLRIYRILNTEINIIFLHWNKQHLESGIIKWGCRLLDENFHLVLMITCVAMQICHRVGR